MIEVANAESFVLVTLHGALDVASVSTLEGAFAPLTDHRIVIVSLAAVSYLDSSILSVLVRQQNALEGGLVVILPAGSPLERIFDITGLRPYLRLTPDADQAFALARQLRDGSAASFPREGVATES